MRHTILADKAKSKRYALLLFLTCFSLSLHAQMGKSFEIGRAHV